MKAESKDPNSILSFYKRLLALRQSEPALRDGLYLPLIAEDPYVLAYLRKKPNNSDVILVVLNMSAEPRTVKFDLAAEGIGDSSAKPLIASPEMGHDSTLLSHFTIPEFGVFIGSVH